MPESPAPPPIVSRATDATFGLWFPFFQWMASRLPPVWLQRLAAATAERAIWGRESVRAAILGNYARVLGAPERSRAVEDAARAMVASHSRLWIDLLRYSARPERVRRELRVTDVGTERLLAARNAGKGAILLTAHVGNFELGGLFLRELGLDVAVVYAPDPSPVVEAHRARARERMGVAGIPVTTSALSSLNVLRALDRNAFVAMQGDRDVSSTGRPVRLFDTPVSFPVGPFKLAAAAGAPLLPVFVLQEPGRAYRTVVEAPIAVEDARRGGREEALGDAMAAFAAVLERTIRTYPEQWYRFTPFWDGA